MDPISIDSPITGYHKDAENHWVAELACGHFQHVRHNPPWVNRPWVTSLDGRQSMLGYKLACKKCALDKPADTHSFTYSTNKLAIMTTKTKKNGESFKLSE